MTLTGQEAIAYATLNELALNKYADPTEDARSGISIEDACEIADEDPSLIWLEVPAARYEVRVINNDRFGALFLATDDAGKAKTFARESGPNNYDGVAIIDTVSGTADMGDRTVNVSDAFSREPTRILPTHIIARWKAEDWDDEKMIAREYTYEDADTREPIELTEAEAREYSWGQTADDCSGGSQAGSLGDE